MLTFKNMLTNNLFFMRLLRAARIVIVNPAWNKMKLMDNKEWSASLKTGSGKKILVATSVGSHLPGAVLESLIAIGLTLRGAKVDVLLCDGLLPACLDCMLGITISEKEMAGAGPQKRLCRLCRWIGERIYRPLGLTIHTYSSLIDNVTKNEIEKIADEMPYSQISTYKFMGLSVGEHALAGALRFYACGVLNKEMNSEKVLRRYFKASLLTASAVNKLIDENKFDCAVFHHGIYVPQGLIGEACRNGGTRLVNWNPAYRKKCFIFSHGDTYHHTLMQEPTAVWENLSWNPKIEQKLLQYLKSRWKGTEDWIWFHEKPRFDIDDIARELTIDYSKPIIGILTNVFWDAQLHYPANIFPNMLKWLLESIEHLGKRNDLQIVIRIHPAEVTSTIPSRQKLADEIAKSFPVLPANTRVILPESQISTYAVMEKCDSVIVYGTKTGVELTCAGIPVIVAGEAWIRNKGISIDPATREEYFSILDKLPTGSRMTAEQIHRARKYAFHFFFRRMIPIKSLYPQKGWPPYFIGIDGLSDIKPGNDPGFDTICNGILHGTAFVYKAEDEEKQSL